ncbi:MAG: O-antigen ligase [Candidatus Zixiibacteriota bacterium]
MTDQVQKFIRNGAIFCLYGYFVSTTFSHALGQTFFGLALLFVLCRLMMEKRLFKKPHFDLFGIFIVLFVLWSALSSIISPTPAGSLFSLKEEWLFLMIPTAAFIIDDEKILRTCLILFAIAGMLLSIYAIWQHFSGLDLSHGTRLVEAPAGGFGYRVQGTFTHRLTFGNYYAIAALLLLGLASHADRRNLKILFYGAFSLTALASVFTYNRGSLLAMIAGIFLFLLWHGRSFWKYTVALLVVLVIVAAICAPSLFDRYQDSFQTELEGKYAGSRLVIWKTSARMALAHPIFGVGPGNFKDNYIKYRDPENDRVYGHAHNDLLNISAYGGLPAMLFFLGFWAAIVYKILKLIRKMKKHDYNRGIAVALLLGSVVFFLTSIYEATFADEEIRLFLMALWGMVYGMDRLVKKADYGADKIRSN